MSGNTQRPNSYRPPWVKDGAELVPKASVPWRTKVKTAADTDSPADQSNAVQFSI